MERVNLVCNFCSHKQRVSIEKLKKGYWRCAVCERLNKVDANEASHLC